MAQTIRATRPQGATFIELFFDLVFVFAVTQVTGYLIEQLGGVGTLRAALLFWLIWWAWTQFTWTLNAADTEHPRVELLTMAAVAAAFLMALTVPDAFAAGGLWFAGWYTVVRGIGIAGQWWVSAADPEWRAAIRPWTLLSAVGLVVVLVSAVLPPAARTAGLALAAAMDLFAAWRAGDGEWRLHPAHFAERHGLFVIIALGESLIAAGVTATGAPRTGALLSVVIAAVLGACALWWTYFARANDALEHAMAERRSRDRGAFARDVYSLLHFPIICGVIGFAVAIHEAVAHPDEHLEQAGAVALIVGVGLFVGCTGLALRRARRGRPTLRALMVVLLVISYPALIAWPPSGALLLVAVLLTGLAVAEQHAFEGRTDDSLPA